MGKNNKARRAAKAKAKARSRSQASGGRSGYFGPDQMSGDSFVTSEEQARSLLVYSAQAQRDGSGFAANGIAELTRMPVKLVDHQAEALLLDLVSGTWARGWQPAELHRQARRGTATIAAARVLWLAISVDAANRPPSTLDSSWIAQLGALKLPTPPQGRSGWIGDWIGVEGLDRTTATAAIVDAIANLISLPQFDHVLPPPGGKQSAGPKNSTGTNGSVGAPSNPLLDRIRSLLAKAESSDFEAEATALTEKAHELMTRHAIDMALVSGTANAGFEQPVTIRLAVDPPYLDAKSFLLHTVSEAWRCRSVLHVELALITVVGFPEDIVAVETLFTSLLLQAQTALAEAARLAPPGTQVRSQSYKSAFLLAYASRVGERLQEINQAIFDEVRAEQGDAFLPVLRSRSSRVDEHVSQLFGDLVSSSVRGGYNPEGWIGGRMAADMAHLNFGGIEAESTQRRSRQSAPATALGAG